MKPQSKQRPASIKAHTALVPTTSPVCISREAAAKALGICISHFDNLHRDGKGPRCIFLGGRRMYMVEDLVSWARSLAVDSANAPRIR